MCQAAIAKPLLAAGLLTTQITMKRIKSIEKGTGEGSTYFAVNDKYQYAPFGDRIHKIEEEEEKVVGKGMYNDLTIKVYNGYDAAGQLLFTIEAMSALTIIYDVA